MPKTDKCILCAKRFKIAGFEKDREHICYSCNNLLGFLKINMEIIIVKVPKINLAHVCEIVLEEIKSETNV